MKPKRVVVYNLIPLLMGSARNAVRLAGAPADVLKKVRASCSYQGKDLNSWASEVEKHCPIPFSHPFRRLLPRLAAGDPLRTLGAWAYGGGNSWITLEETEWEDGSRTSPQEEHRGWLRKEASKILR